ncbi:MAG: pyruvate kinase, partial [Clostridiales bacterium]|nr:pyruvate kinase [Clostridiales bacterium]
MAKTKIVCTIGPASESPAVLLRMVKAGMSVARINMSHGSHEEQKKKIETLKEVREKTGVPFAIMIDTKGPEYRIGIFKDGGVTLNEGDTFTFTTDDIVGDETKVSVSYKNLHNEMSIGDRILLNNGLLEFEVESIVGKD